MSERQPQGFASEFEVTRPPEQESGELKKPPIETYIEKMLVAQAELMKKNDPKKPSKTNEKLLAQVQKTLVDLSDTEKATLLFENLQAISTTPHEAQGDFEVHESEVTEDQEQKTGVQKDKVTKFAKPAIDPFVFHQFTALWKDEKVKKMFLETYGIFRQEKREISSAELTQLRKDITIARKNIADLRQFLFLKRYKNPTEKKAATSKLILERKIFADLVEQRDDLLNLENLDQTKANTDAIALDRYATIQQYSQEAQKGFVWTESREELLETAANQIEETGKGVLVIGPPGTGKTSFIAALAREFTGKPVMHFGCNSDVAEDGLAFRRDIKDGETSFDYEGTLAEAYTGYKHSTDTEPSSDTGSLINLDEISMLDPQKTQSVIKEVRGLKAGQRFHRAVPKPVLPGAILTATSNSPLSEEAMEREFARIPTGYFPMSAEQPELFEFFLAKLFQERGTTPAISKTDLEPKWTEKEIPKADQKKLKDGSYVVAESTLEQDQTNPEHGYLYRLSCAIHAMQDSYIHGSKFNEKHLATSALYLADNMTISGFVPDLKKEDKSKSLGGQMLLLSSGSSAITAETVSRWTDSFFTSGEQDMVVWFQRMLKGHMAQTSPDDAEKIELIANYFHLFDERTERSIPEKPLTPLEIGYLSPRVPRPVKTEKRMELLPNAEDKEGESKEAKEKELTMLTLEDGTEVNTRVKDISFKSDDETVEVFTGRSFSVDGVEYTFAGVVEEPGNAARDGKVVGEIAGTELHKIFALEELDKGIVMHEGSELIKEVENEIAEQMAEYWQTNCENNEENNPDKIPAPTV